MKAVWTVHMNNTSQQKKYLINNLSTFFNSGSKNGEPSILKLPALSNYRSKSAGDSTQSENFSKFLFPEAPPADARNETFFI